SQQSRYIAKASAAAAAIQASANMAPTIVREHGGPALLTVLAKAFVSLPDYPDHILSRVNTRTEIRIKRLRAHQDVEESRSAKRHAAVLLDHLHSSRGARSASCCSHLG